MIVIVLTDTLPVVKVEDVARRTDTSERARCINTSSITANVCRIATLINI